MWVITRAIITIITIIIIIKNAEVEHANTWPTGE